MPTIDFQTQLVSERFSTTLPESFRKWGRFWAKPMSYALHEAQPLVRFLPKIGRNVVEELGALAPLSHLLVESSKNDLIHSMEKNGIDQCVLLSDPERIPNSELLKIAEEDPRMIPAIRIPRACKNDQALIREEIQSAHERGARILQIHPASDGIPPESDFYSRQIDEAATLEWKVIVQTGTPKSSLVYRSPDDTSIARFEHWFKNWTKTPFIIARMNFEEPQRAIDFAEVYPQLYLETSWQPSEVIAEAVRRIGSERVLFGSDWPVMGNNQRVGIRRIRNAVEFEMISPEDAENILGKTAESLLKGNA